MIFARALALYITVCWVFFCLLVCLRASNLACSQTGLPNGLHLVASCENNKYQTVRIDNYAYDVSFVHLHGVRNKQLCFSFTLSPLFAHWVFLLARHVYREFIV